MLYSKGILESHLYLPIEELKIPIKKLRRLLTARPKYAELAAIPMYDESRDGYFGIPRHYKNLISSVKDLKIETSDGIPSEHVFTSRLWDNQAPLFEEFKSAVDKGKTGFILKARTASGKTVMLLKFLEYLGTNALIIVPSSSLLTQWRERIVEHTSYSESDIGHVQADIVNYKDKPITIGMLHSICRDKYGEEFNNHFGVIMWDEIHRSGAELFSNAVSMFTAKYRIGASGTISRPDGMEVVFNNHLNEFTISLGGEREEELRPKIIVLGQRGSQNFIPRWAKNIDSVKKRGVIISAIAKNQARNDILLSNIIKLAMSGRRVLVISDRIEQLNYLYKNTYESHKPGMFISTTSSKNKEAILKNSGIIYATYGMFSTGMDVKDLAGLVFATPQSRIRQTVGRILRLYKGKKRPVIIDTVDNDIIECTRWYRNRIKEYKHSDIKGEVIVT
jgi:superfamily II DNA or RNA helicase